VQFSSRGVRSLSFFVGILSLATAVGCGNSGSGVTLPHPSGNYSNASLNGSYVYQVRGGPSSVGIYREFGVLIADGAGHITGVDDFVAASTGQISSSTTGSYSVANDGTGFITLNNTALGTVNFAITLVSISRFDLIEADPGANAAGIADLQNSTAVTAVPSGTFVYRLHETATTTGQNSVAEAGVFTVSAGAATGNLDQNFGGTVSQLTLTGNFNSPDTFGTGTGSFTDSTNFTTNFIYYIISSSKIALLVTNSGTIESGSAEFQSGAVSAGLSGNYVFGSRGDLGSFSDAVATAGVFTANGTGAITSYTNDSMRLCVSSSNSFTGSYTTSANGRTVVNLNSGANQQIFWMVSPSRAFFITESPNVIEDGTADLQTVATFSASTIKGQYALMMDGNDLTPEYLSRIGTLQFDGAGKITLTEEVNASNSGNGAVSPGVLTGTYQVSPSGIVDITITGSTLNLVMYAASGSGGYALQLDGGTDTSGTMELQH